MAYSKQKNSQGNSLLGTTWTHSLLIGSCQKQSVYSWSLLLHCWLFPVKKNQNLLKEDKQWECGFVYFVCLLVFPIDWFPKEITLSDHVASLWASVHQPVSCPCPWLCQPSLRFVITGERREVIVKPPREKHVWTCCEATENPCKQRWFCVPWWRGRAGCPRPPSGLLPHGVSLRSPQRWAQPNSITNATDPQTAQLGLVFIHVFWKDRPNHK